MSTFKRFVFLSMIVVMADVGASSVPPRYPFGKKLRVKTISLSLDNIWGVAFQLVNEGEAAFDSLEVRFYFDAENKDVYERFISFDTTDYEMAAMVLRTRFITTDLFLDSVGEENFKNEIETRRVRPFSSEVNSETGQSMFVYAVPLSGISIGAGEGIMVQLCWVSCLADAPEVELTDRRPLYVPGREDGDWSWGAKEQNERYPLAFEGVNESSGDYLPYSRSEMNPYVTVFRNEKLLYGFPPDWREYYGDTFEVPETSDIVTEPVPYKTIAMPFHEYTDQITRDSANMRISRIRVNQSGYRPQDEKYFYYIDTAEATEFSVVDRDGNTVGSGLLNTTGMTGKGKIEIRPSSNSNSVVGDNIVPWMDSPLIEGDVYEGMVPDLNPGTYRIVVGEEVSAPFEISEGLYNWVRDALLKFYGVQRCGDSKSWFHGPCHLQDAVTGGWHDGGDHLKEGATMSYAAAVLGLAAAAFSDRDHDRYDVNHAYTQTTDGVPDMLYEAKYGADFILRSYDKADGEVDNMVTSVGGFGGSDPECGEDHNYWGRPENQDMMPLARGGAPRCGRSEPTSDYLGKYAANLAFVSRLYKEYDTEYSQKCLTAAKAIYEFTKDRRDITNTSAYNGSVICSDDLAFGCLALLWATEERQYLDELCYDTTIGSKATHGMKALFTGGWFTSNDPIFTHTMANTDWASVQSHVLWGFFKLILQDESLCSKLEISEDNRLELIEKTVFNLISNLASVGNGTEEITLPDAGIWVPSVIKYDPLWFSMHTQMEWMWNNHQAGNITEMFYYYDIASTIQGLGLPNTPAVTDWKADEVKRVLIRMLDYMFGVNPWDISMVYGIGEKNFNHPLHRASNPEMRNCTFGYDYSHLTGALIGSYEPSSYLYQESVDDFYHSEVGLNGTTNLLMPVCGLAHTDMKVSRRFGVKKLHTERNCIRVIPKRGCGALRIASEEPVKQVVLFNLAGRCVEKKRFSQATTTSVSLKIYSGIGIVKVESFNGNVVVRRIPALYAE